MTQRLEELFNLPVDEQGEQIESVADNPEVVTGDISAETLGNVEKIESALPAVNGLEASDIEMDDLADLAKESYKDLMDLGMNVEPRHASEIFGSAATMLGHAISAKNAKVNKKLKMIDLQLKKMRLDQTANKGGDDAPLAEGKVLDRNELMQRLIDAQQTPEETQK